VKEFSVARVMNPRGDRCRKRRIRGRETGVRLTKRNNRSVGCAYFFSFLLLSSLFCMLTVFKQWIKVLTFITLLLKKSFTASDQWSVAKTRNHRGIFLFFFSTRKSTKYPCEGVEKSFVVVVCDTAAILDLAEHVANRVPWHALHNQHTFLGQFIDPQITSQCMNSIWTLLTNSVIMGWTYPSTTACSKYTETQNFGASNSSILYLAF